MNNLSKIENEEYSFKMYSVDLFDNFYRGEEKTGFLAQSIIGEMPGNCQHKFLTGDFLPHRLHEIGSNIDFVILDTVHRCPGEILDTLALLPFLSENCIIVYHDVILSHISDVKTWNYSNMLCLCAVEGERIFLRDKSRNNGIGNIAAIQCNNKTAKMVEGVFLTLMIDWKYMPGEEEIKIYKEFYKSIYDEKCLWIFDNAVELNRKSVEKKCYYGKIGKIKWKIKVLLDMV